jgi:hypothetical protein
VLHWEQSKDYGHTNGVAPNKALQPTAATVLACQEKRSPQLPRLLSLGVRQVGGLCSS